MKHKNPGRRRCLIAVTSKLALIALAASTSLMPISAAAQAPDWPNRPIRIIVPFPAGSFTDTVARVMSERFSKALGEPVIVENKAGANGVIGMTEAARATPDGYTFLVTNSSSVTINPQIYSKVNYKPADFTPISLILEAPFILVVNPEWAQQNAIGSVNDLIQYAAQNPDKLSYGSAGPGNIAHLGFAMLSNRANIKTTHIPYKSAAQAQLAVLSGEIQAALDTWTALPHIAAGKLKPLATSSSQRMAQLPELTTMEEAGIAPFDVTFWIGLLAPVGTPPQVVEKLESIAQKVLDDSKAKATLGAQGNVVMIGGADYAKRIEKEIADWADVIRTEGIKID